MLEVQGVCHLIPVKAVDEYQYTFQAGYDLFGPSVTLFDMNNLLADFLGYINTVIWDALDDFT